MDTEVVLFTRQEKCYKPGVIRKLYNLFSPPGEKYTQNLVFPEELFTDIVGELLGLHIEKRYDTESVSSEDPFGKFPCMVAHNNYVARENIIAYFKAITNINSWLTVPQLRSLEWLESLVITKLHLVTKTQQLRIRGGEITSMFRFIQSPIRSLLKYKNYKDFEECCERFCNLHGDMQAYDIAQEVYEKLTEKLGENEYFYEKEGEPATKQISSLDLVVYAYLKEQLVNIPESKIVDMLTQRYKNLVNFVERIDKLVNKVGKVHKLRIKELKITSSSQEKQAIVHNFMQPSEYTSTDRQHDQFEDISEDGIKKQWTRRLGTAVMATAFMLHLKYGRTAFN